MKFQPRPFIASHVTVPIHRALTSAPAPHASPAQRPRQDQALFRTSRARPPALGLEYRSRFRQNLIRHARLEARALAGSTPFPDLFFPCLLEEKLEQARRYTERQERLWNQSQSIITRIA